jgi:hypothetical protein
MMTDRLAKFRNRKAAKASGVTPPKTPPLGPGGAPAMAAAVNGTGDVGEGRDGEGGEENPANVGAMLEETRNAQEVERLRRQLYQARNEQSKVRAHAFRSLLLPVRSLPFLLCLFVRALRLTVAPVSRSSNLTLFLSFSHTHTHARAHARTHAHTHTHARARSSRTSSSTSSRRTPKQGRRRTSASGS